MGGRVDDDFGVVGIRLQACYLCCVQMLALVAGALLGLDDAACASKVIVSKWINSKP